MTVFGAMRVVVVVVVVVVIVIVASRAGGELVGPSGDRFGPYAGRVADCDAERVDPASPVDRRVTGVCAGRIAGGDLVDKCGLEARPTKALLFGERRSDAEGPTLPWCIEDQLAIDPWGSGRPVVDR